MRFYSGIFLAVVLAAVATPSNAFFIGNGTLGIFDSTAGLLTRVKSASTGLKGDLITLAMMIAQELRSIAEIKRMAITNNIRDALTSIRAAKTSLFTIPGTRGVDVTGGSNLFTTFLDTIFETLGPNKFAALFPRDFETRALSADEEHDDTDSTTTTTTTTSEDEPRAVSSDLTTTTPASGEKRQRENLYGLLSTSMPVDLLAYKNQRSSPSIDSEDSTFHSIPVTPKLARSTKIAPTSDDTTLPTTSSSAKPVVR